MMTNTFFLIIIPDELLCRIYIQLKQWTRNSNREMSLKAAVCLERGRVMSHPFEITSSADLTFSRCQNSERN